MADAILAVARAALEDGGPVAGVGIANQRASSIVWERATGKPVAPGIGWQDLRTVGTCLVLQAEGIRLAPNASATKVMAILDEVDPERSRAERGELCFGTVDSWVAWTLSGGAGSAGDALHVTDATNAAVTALVDGSIAWDEALLQKLRVPLPMLPSIVDSSGTIGVAAALPGAPPICGIAGDQQASLVGQGCTLPGLAKATFGTGGMLDQCTGPGGAPVSVERGGAGTFPIVAFRVGGEATWGTEAVMLSAGTAIEWLRDDLGIIATAQESEDGGGPVRLVGRRVVRPGAARLGHPRLGLRGPGNARRADPGIGASRDRAGRPRGRGPPRGRSGRRERERQRLPDRRAAHRRRHDGQCRVRRGAGRRHRTPRRDLADTGGHHTGSRAPGRFGRGNLRVDGRPRRHLLAAADRRTEEQRRRPSGLPRAMVGGTPQGRRHHPGTLGHLLLSGIRTRSEGDRCLPRNPFPVIFSAAQVDDVHQTEQQYRRAGRERSPALPFALGKINPALTGRLGPSGSISRPQPPISLRALRLAARRANLLLHR